VPEGDSYTRAAARARPYLVGREVTAVEGSARSVRRHSRSILGRRVDDIRTRGKHLLFDMDSGLTIHVHLGMPGRVRTGRGRLSARDRGPLRLGLSTEAGSVWVLSAPTVEVARREEIEGRLERLGPDLLAEEFDWDRVPPSGGQVPRRSHRERFPPRSAGDGRSGQRVQVRGPVPGEDPAEPSHVRGRLGGAGGAGPPRPPAAGTQRPPGGALDHRTTRRGRLGVRPQRTPLPSMPYRHRGGVGGRPAPHHLLVPDLPGLTKRGTVLWVGNDASSVISDPQNGIRSRPRPPRRRRWTPRRRPPPG
jgi:hypothetical protein